MEFGDASDEEAPPAPPRNKDLLRNVWMQIVVMLQGMENDGSLQRGSVTTITKDFAWHAAQFTAYGRGRHACMPQA